MWRGYAGLAEFSQPVEARHLRINVVTFSGWPSLRFRLLAYNPSYLLSSFDPSKSLWETLPPFLGMGRYRHGMTALEDGHLYVFGGKDDEGAS